ncbi:hypothetical protein LOZ80_00620 [Paenibacillus sp. HWE-109]|uniref:hypothetical protein n=1 Tax=Paenibacillus sp. HWE-109 TaxID=1306526 RepID=UPI001EDC9BBF|nr:hypothetical protein [Paenibacillus sp. HWE-109]UKS27490.1 hypothetical protein LOZ80_00620 [Paenibacillus sp. HWE-109]
MAAVKLQAKELKAAEKRSGNQTNFLAPIRGIIYDSMKSPLAYTIHLQSLFFRGEPGQQNEDEIIALAIREDIN